MKRIYTLTDGEKEQLTAALLCDPRNDPLDLILTKIESGEIAAWRPEYAQHSLVLTQIIIWPRGRELALLYLFGEGILAVADQLVSDLEVVGRLNGCSWISGDGAAKAWPKIITKLGFTPMQTSYLKDI